MSGEPVYLYFQCTICDYDMVLRADAVAGKQVWCLLCQDDNQRISMMNCREALPSDNPEGVDVRRSANET